MLSRPQFSLPIWGFILKQTPPFSKGAHDHHQFARLSALILGMTLQPVTLIKPPAAWKLLSASASDPFDSVSYRLWNLDCLEPVWIVDLCCWHFLRACVDLDPWIDGRHGGHHQGMPHRGCPHQRDTNHQYNNILHKILWVPEPPELTIVFCVQCSHQHLSE